MLQFVQETDNLSGRSPFFNNPRIHKVEQHNKLKKVRQQHIDASEGFHGKVVECLFNLGNDYFEYSDF